MELAGYNKYSSFCQTMWMWLDEQEKVTGVMITHMDAEPDNIYYYFFCFHDTTGAYLYRGRGNRVVSKRPLSEN